MAALISVQRELFRGSSSVSSLRRWVSPAKITVLIPQRCKILESITITWCSSLTMMAAPRKTSPMKNYDLSALADSHFEMICLKRSLRENRSNAKVWVSELCSPARTHCRNNGLPCDSVVGWIDSWRICVIRDIGIYIYIYIYTLDILSTPGIINPSVRAFDRSDPYRRLINFWGRFNLQARSKRCNFARDKSLSPSIEFKVYPSEARLQWVLIFQVVIRTKPSETVLIGDSRAVHVNTGCRKH